MELKNNEQKISSGRPRPASNGMETQVYNQKGESLGKIKLPASVFGLKWNADLVHQVVTSMRSSARAGTAHTKNRGEVRGGGKKPWRQKGTGRARHGSIRSPIWVGGGVAHGPRNEKNYSRKINQKMKVKALFCALSQKLRDGEIVFIDEFKFDAAKTKKASEVLSNLRKIKELQNVLSRNNAALVALGEKEKNVLLSFRNIPNITLDETRNLNPVSVLNKKALIFVNPEASIRILEAKIKREEKDEAEKMRKVTPTEKPKVAAKKKTTAKLKRVKK